MDGCALTCCGVSLLNKAASSSGDNVITCPGVEPQILGKPIFIEISLNKGITFITNNLKFRGKDCGENPAAKPTEDKAGNPSKVNSQSPIEQTPEKAPEMPQEAPPKNLLGKAPEQAPGKHLRSPPQSSSSVLHFISTGSRDFPWIPVVAGAAALLFILLLCSFFYLCCWTVCCSPPCPVMITRCCDFPGTGRLNQMEVSLPTVGSCPAPRAP
nr:uncharacterized protein LOC131278895 [Dasypus novemcinctus]